MQHISAALMLVSLVTGQPMQVQAEISGADADAMETAVADAQVPTVQDVLLDVCEARGYGEDCAKTLLGMVWVESNNVYDAVGDQGRARGYFQIWYRLHGISVDCAEDLVCSADWTISYLERNSYPTYESYAVQCHNSCNAGNGYAAKVARHGERLWDDPMTVDQTAPIDLSQIGERIALNQ